ncbi:MAG: hypothetical protein ACM3S2_20655 [Ignavibacteriales bacterium]
MSDQFHYNRVLLLLRREVALNRWNIVILFVSLTFISIFTDLNAVKHLLKGVMIGFHNVTYQSFVLVYGIILTALSFSELNSSDRKIEFLMLPSSVLEKYLSKFIYTTFGFLLVALAAFLLSSLIIEVWMLLLGGEYFYGSLLSSFSTLSTLPFLQTYIILHSITFFGAIYFRKMEPAKIFLSGIGLIVTIYCFDSLLNQLPFLRNPDSMLEIPIRVLNSKGLSMVTQRSALAIKKYYLISGSIVSFVALYLIPLFFWGLAYLRLRESEVRDGV